MQLFARSVLGAAAVLASFALASTASARTETVSFDHLVESATVGTPFGVDDTLFLDTFISTETGALTQSVTFTVASGVSRASGSAAWFATDAAGAGPRLVGVNLDIVDSGNNVVFSDTFGGATNGIATSTFLGSIGPGTYTLIATGNGVRASSLDVSLTFAVPEPSTYALMLAGAGVIGFMARRRRPDQRSL